MNRVIYSPEIFCWQRYGGVSRYFTELIPAVRDLGWTVEIAAGLYLSDYLATSRHAAVVRGREIWCRKRIGKLGRSGLLLLNSFAFHAMRGNARSVIHQTYYSPFVKRNGRLVITVHDLIHEKFMSSRQRRWAKAARKRTIMSAEKVIAVSEATRRDLLELYNLPAYRVTVIHHGVRFVNESPVANEQSHARQPYLLYVGTRNGYKNFPRLVQAFADSRLLRLQIKLVCFGGGRFTSEEKKLLARCNVAHLVEWTEGDDSQLDAHYRDATALVYPSLYEGFGLPVLEAMAKGCPVICSNTSALPEVGGDAVVYFSPHDVNSMREVLERTLVDRDLLSLFAERGRQRAKTFTWQEAARKTVAVYETICP